MSAWLIAAAVVALMWGVKRLTSSTDPVVLVMPVLRELEGFSANRYWDSAQYSIGYGSRWEPDMPLTITEPAAAALLEERIRTEYYPSVQSRATTAGLNPQQTAALISAVYNLGPGMLTWSWWTAYLASDFSTARRKFLGYTHSNPVIAAALLKRRKKEWYWFRTGTYNANAGNMSEAQLPL
jgi:GH24 family phage-related lysozyme (muramidase)